MYGVEYIKWWYGDDYDDVKTTNIHTLIKYSIFICKLDIHITGRVL